MSPKPFLILIFDNFGFGDGFKYYFGRAIVERCARRLNSSFLSLLNLNYFRITFLQNSVWFETQKVLHHPNLTWIRDRSTFSLWFKTLTSIEPWLGQNSPQKTEIFTNFWRRKFRQKKALCHMTNFNGMGIINKEMPISWIFHTISALWIVGILWVMAV